jgi:DNA mismatch repair protein MutS2
MKLDAAPVLGRAPQVQEGLDDTALPDAVPVASGPGRSTAAGAAPDTAPPAFVDLLGGTPKLRINTVNLRQSLTFAFNAGGNQADLARAVSEARQGDSLWSADCFSDDLFLGQLIERCLWRGRGAARSSASAGVRRYLLGVLSSPPYGADALEVVRFRQEISAELDSDAGLMQRIEALFELLEAGGVGVRLDPTRRALDILAATKRLVDMGLGFGAARSGLRRIAEWSRGVQSGSGYRKLKDLLDYDGRLAMVQVNVRVGREGDVRGMDVVRIAENADNPFHVSPWRRFWGRLSLGFRGYRLRKEEVFARLVHDTFDGIMQVFAAALQLLGDLELYRLGISLATFARERGLAVCLPEFGGSARSLNGLFNPFLLLEERAPRPCDLTTGGAGAIVIITGPNSGGKTRLLQALGISQVLGQAGLFVPAQSARLPWQDGLFASLAVVPEADQREGRLGTELLRIRRMFEQLEVGSLVLVDELCSGTNPAEAEELFRMVLELLSGLSAQAFVTTHFLEFAARLELSRPLPGLEFLCVGLDADKRPTYRFERGVAESALAQQTAQRLGVTQTELEALVHAAIERRGERAARGQVDPRSTHPGLPLRK